MKKITKTESWKPTELFFTNQEEKASEKEEFMKEFESIWDETFGKMNGICLYFTSANRKVADEEFHHKNLSEVKELYLNELSEIFDKTRFSKVEINKPTIYRDELEVTLWVRTTECSSNGNSVYVRFCTNDEYKTAKEELEKENAPTKIKEMYIQKLEETAFKPDAQSIKRGVLTDIKNLISDTIYELEGNWIDSLSLRTNNVLEDILEELEKSTLYYDIKDVLAYEYKDDDTIIFKIANTDEEITVLSRQTVVTHNFAW